MNKSRVYLQPSIVRELKGIKHKVEIEGLRKCHVSSSNTSMQYSIKVAPVCHLVTFKTEANKKLLYIQDS